MNNRKPCWTRSSSSACVATIVAHTTATGDLSVNYPSMSEERTAITLTFRDSPDQMLELPLPPPDTWTEQGR